MTEGTTPERYGDPTTEPFWEAAERRQLCIQRCRACGKHQFFPRPVCISCFGTEVDWVVVSGNATVYSQTTVRIPVTPELQPPYVVAVVTLDEGPRITTNLVGPPCQIGDRVRLAWRDREGLPPLPVFGPTDEDSGDHQPGAGKEVMG